MTKDEVLKIAQDACPYFDEISKGAFYDGFITALDHFRGVRKLIEPDVGIDRGTWDEFGNSGMQYSEECDLIGGETDCVEEPPNSTTDVEEPELVAWVLLDLWKTGQHWPDDCFNSEGGEGMTPLYTAPIKRKGWQYAKECEAEVQRLKEIIDELENDDPPPKREFVGLTDEEEIELDEKYGDDFNAYIDARDAKLKEKNHG